MNREELQEAIGQMCFELTKRVEALKAAHDAVEVQNKRLAQDVEKWRDHTREAVLQLNAERAETERLREEVAQLKLDILAMARAFQSLTPGT